MNSMTQNKLTVPDDTAARTDRMEMFLSYGFSVEQALALTDARDGLWPLHHLRVKRALDAGATHDQAMAMFA